jgi:hypothetical protein
LLTGGRYSEVAVRTGLTVLKLANKKLRIGGKYCNLRNFFFNFIQ